MKKVLYLLLVMLFIVSIDNVYAAEDLSKATWWIYDHTNFEDKAIISDEEHKYIEYYFESHPTNYVIDRHIYVQDNGKTLNFKGYGIDPFTDFLYYPNDSNEEKSFSLNINRNTETVDIWHTFQAMSIFFNTKITGNYTDDSQRISTNAIVFGLTGTYLIEIKDWSTKQLLDGGYMVAFKDFALIGYNWDNLLLLHKTGKNLYSDTYNYKMIAGSYSVIEKPYNKIRLDISDNKIKLYVNTTDEYYAEELEEWNLHEWTLLDDSKTKEVTLDNPSGSHGFGIATSYNYHSCEKKTNFIVTDLSFPVKIDLDSPVSITQNEDKCDSKEYAEKNAGECCKQYPDTCRCDNEAYAKRNPELCNDIKCVGFNDTELGKLLQQIFSFVQIGVVAILILTGTIDFVKAASSKDEQQMKKFQNDFVKRLIVGAVIFFIPIIINFLFPLLDIGGTCGIK